MEELIIKAGTIFELNPEITCRPKGTRAIVTDPCDRGPAFCSAILDEGRIWICRNEQSERNLKNSRRNVFGRIPSYSTTKLANRQQST